MSATRPWVRLYADINRDPRLLAASIATRCIYLQMLPELDASGSYCSPPSVPLHIALSLVTRVPEDEVRAAVIEGERLGLWLPSADRITVPSFTARQGGEASRGGKSSAERMRALRARKRDASRATESDGARVTVSDVVCDSTSDDSVTEQSSQVTVSDSDNTAEITRENESVTDCYGVDKSREEKSRVEENTLSLSLSRDVTQSDHGKPKSDRTAKGRKVKPAIEDPVPSEGQALKVYRAIVGDRILGPITAGPGDFAERITAEGAYPRVDVLAEVRKAGEYAARGKTAYRDGRAYLSRWLSRAAEDAAKRPAPITRLPTQAERDEGIEQLIAEGLM